MEGRGRRGVAELPTGSGKTLVAQLALRDTPRSALICVPTLDLLQQWYSGLLAAFPDAHVGLLGGGSHDDTPILVSTYDSAAIHAEDLAGKYALLICDECHHLPVRLHPRDRGDEPGPVPPGPLRHPETQRRPGKGPGDPARPGGVLVRPGRPGGETLADYREVVDQGAAQPRGAGPLRHPDPADETTSCG